MTHRSITARTMLGLSLVAATLGLAVPALSMPDAVRIPKLRPRSGGASGPAALFLHSSHAQTSCYTCHPALFPQRPLGFTHADMNVGRFCGACHDGRTAFAVPDVKCERCHVPR